MSRYHFLNSESAFLFFVPIMQPHRFNFAPVLKVQIQRQNKNMREELMLKVTLIYMLFTAYGNTVSPQTPTLFMHFAILQKARICQL